MPRGYKATVDSRKESRRRQYVPKLTLKGPIHVRFLFKLMHDNKVTYQQMEDRSGVSYYTIKKWRCGRSPDLQNIEACLNVMGYALKPARIRS